mmetsp:Transcript_41835/g.100495  ORF Transcript_41835/g.100495 Transcript_41835/m.100495 type:complete len:246 (-) Transcript_41835:86-823(-)
MKVLAAGCFALLAEARLGLRKQAPTPPALPVATTPTPQTYLLSDLPKGKVVVAPVDYQSLLTKMGKMETEIQSLSNSLVAVNSMIATLEAGIGTRQADLQAAQRSLNMIEATSRKNMAELTSLSLKANAVENEAFNSNAEVQAIAGRVSKMEQTTKVLGPSSKALAARVVKLEADVTGALPGISGVGKDLAKAKAKVVAFEKKVDTEIDGLVKAKLQDTVTKMRKEINRLHEQVQEGMLTDTLGS